MKKNIPFGSVIRKKFIPDPDPGFVGGGGVKKHRIPDPDPQHCYYINIYIV
jgi:hypothetical protein